MLLNFMQMYIIFYKYLFTLFVNFVNNHNCVFVNTKLLVGSQENKTTASLSTPVISEQVHPL